jgi:hypothetical protein
VTPFDWAPDKVPIQQAAEQVALQFCRSRGHVGLAAFKFSKGDQAGAERFETAASLTTRFCSYCEMHFTEIACSN